MTFMPITNVIPGAVSRVQQMPGAPVTGTAEVQTLSSTATTGSYRLDFGGAVTGPLLATDVAATVQAALIALVNIPAGGVVVAGAAFPKTITFAGGLATGLQPLIKVVNSTLNAAATVARTTPGVAPTLQGAAKGSLATRADTGALMSNTGTPAAPVWTAT